MGEATFSDVAVEVLRRAAYDPAAGWLFELTTASFIWPDEEFTAFAAATGAPHDRRAFAVVIYRSSLILGQPRDDCRGAWQELLRRCPEWPGFRAERRVSGLRDTLIQLLQDPDDEYRDHRRMLSPPGLSLPTAAGGPIASET